MADESCQSLHDAYNLVRAQARTVQRHVVEADA
jgi:hypothetical protein